MIAGYGPPACAGLDLIRLRGDRAEGGAAPADAVAEVLNAWLDGLERVL